VVERIAAGEVVERPASVVRELIENALDAHATSITVEIEDGGLRAIRVVDDGWGIPSAEIALALAKHTTSKLTALDELAHVATLGFRGEALASIAAVSELRLSSAADDAGVATAMTMRGGVLASSEREARSRGTTAIVRDLFAGVPARRAVLRSPASEARQVLATVRDYALSHPSVRFLLRADDHVLLSTPGSDTATAILALYGADLARSVYELPAQLVGSSRISGWVASRAFTQRDARHVCVCVNGRPVTNSILTASIQAAYRPLLRKGRHPIALLAIETDPANIDVNVHPAKRHVLLREERAIGAALREAVHMAVGARPTESPPPLTALTRTYHHVSQTSFPTRRPRRVLREPAPLFVPRRLQPGANAAGASLVSLQDASVLGQLDARLIVAQSPAGDLLLLDQHRAHERLLYDALCRQAGPHSARQMTAHGARDRGSGGQLLLEPLLVELSQRQAAILASRLAELATLGLVCEPFGGATFLVRALPTLPESATPLASVASELAADAAEDADDWLDHLRAALACRAALRRGQPLSVEEQRALVADLATTDAPAVCPHGSPIIVSWPRDELARTFEW
jgi:DNA mismatch repair protein MutL